MRSAYAHDNFSARARATFMLPLCSTLTSARLVCCTGDLMQAQYEATSKPEPTLTGAISQIRGIK